MEKWEKNETDSLKSAGTNQELLRTQKYVVNLRCITDRAQRTFKLITTALCGEELGLQHLNFSIPRSFLLLSSMSLVLGEMLQGAACLSWKIVDMGSASL